MANTAKYLNYDGVLYLWQKIKASFVAKVDGKGLSTNDYTTEEKTKLATLSANGYTLPTASATTLGGVKIGSNLTVTNGVLSADKTVTKTSELTNDSGYITATAVADTYAAKTDIPSKTSVLTNDSGYQTQDQVNDLIATKLTSAVKYKGSVADLAALNALTGMVFGDMYNVMDSDMNYIYGSSGWDPAAPTITINNVANSDIDTITAS